MNVIALNQFSVMGARVLGMVLAGYLLARIGVVPVIAARALGSLIGIVFLLFARVPPTPAAARKTTAWRNVVEGVRYVQGNPLILTLTFMFVVNQFANTTATSLMPAFAEGILGLGPEGYGWLNGVMAAGAFGSTLLLASLRDFTHKGFLFITAGMVLGASLVGFSLSQWFYISLFFLMIFGCTNSMFRGLNTTIVQGTIPDEVRGRVMSLREVGNGLGSAGAVLAGGIGEWAGVTFAIGSLGVGFLAVILAMILFLPRVREVE
jgi:MFS family permease